VAHVLARGSDRGGRALRCKGRAAELLRNRLKLFGAASSFPGRELLARFLFLLGLGKGRGLFNQVDFAGVGGATHRELLIHFDKSLIIVFEALNLAAQRHLSALRQLDSALELLNRILKFLVLL